jgi:dTDP-4-amino-4,6-dideoxygalactose transaminase
MTTGGEGGMVTTNDAELWSRAWSDKDHGKSWAEVYERSHPPGFRWLHESIGTNARMIELQAVIGRIQLGCMSEWHAARARNAEAIAQAARACSALRVPVVPPHLEHAWYKFYCFVRPDALKADWSRDRIMAEINAAGVPCYVGSCPEVYLEKAFTSRGLGPSERLSVARQLGETSLMFLAHPTLAGAHLDKAGATIREVMRRATR